MLVQMMTGSTDRPWIRRILGAKCVRIRDRITMDPDPGSSRRNVLESGRDQGMKMTMDPTGSLGAKCMGTDDNGIDNHGSGDPGS